jgi:hypothetical protein
MTDLAAGRVEASPRRWRSALWPLLPFAVSFLLLLIPASDRITSWVSDHAPALWTWRRCGGYGVAFYAIGFALNTMGAVMGIRRTRSGVGPRSLTIPATLIPSFAALFWLFFAFGGLAVMCIYD